VVAAHVEEEGLVGERSPGGQQTKSCVYGRARRPCWVQLEDMRRERPLNLNSSKASTKMCVFTHQVACRLVVAAAVLDTSRQSAARYWPPS